MMRNSYADINKVILDLDGMFGIPAMQGFPTPWAYPGGPKYITICNGNIKAETDLATYCGPDIPKELLYKETLKKINELMPSKNAIVYIRCDFTIEECEATFSNFEDGNYRYSPAAQYSYIRVAFEERKDD